MVLGLAGGGAEVVGASVSLVLAPAMTGGHWQSESVDGAVRRELEEGSPSVESADARAWESGAVRHGRPGAARGRFGSRLRVRCGGARLAERPPAALPLVHRPSPHEVWGVSRPDASD